MTQPKVVDDSDLEWIQLRRDLENNHVETIMEKFNRKFKQNPLIPIGCLATVGALSYGLWSFRQGNQRMSQNMMRMRIGAQGFTICALIIGVVSAFGQNPQNRSQSK